MKNREGIIPAIKIAFAYIGTVIGAGFASGQEILRLFSVYGAYSIWPILIATFLFMFIGTRILKLGFRINSRSYKDAVKQIFGITYPLVSAYIAVSMVLIGGAMLAGSGALFEEYAGIPFWIGAGVTAVVGLAVVLFGIRGILIVNTWIVPLMLIFGLFIFGCTLQGSGFKQEVTPVYNANPIALIRSGVLYAAFNLILSVGVLSSVASKVKQLRTLFIGGILGGGILGIMLFIGDYSLRGQGPGIFDFEVPMLYIIRHLGPAFSGFYVAATWGAIFTTLIANLFSVSSVIHDAFNISVCTSSILVTCLCFAISFMGFSQIIAWFYPLLGVLGFALIIIMLFSGSKY